MMTQQEIIQGIAAYVAKQRSIRHWLTQAPGPQQRAELERALRIVTVVLFGLTRELTKAISTGARASPKASWRTSLDDIDAQRSALIAELGQMEDARDDTLKAADDPAATLPCGEYLAIAAKLEAIAAEMRAAITELESRAELLSGHQQWSPA